MWYMFFFNSEKIVFDQWEARMRSNTGLSLVGWKNDQTYKWSMRVVGGGLVRYAGGMLEGAGGMWWGAGGMREGPTKLKSCFFMQFNSISNLYQGMAQKWARESPILCLKCNNRKIQSFITVKGLFSISFIQAAAMTTATILKNGRHLYHPEIPCHHWKIWIHAFFFVRILFIRIMRPKSLNI